MQHFLKKPNVVLVVLLLSFTGWSIVSATGSEYSVSETVLVDTVVYRHGPDGSITPLMVQVPLKKSMSADEQEETILEFCADLAEHDSEIQLYLEDMGENLSSFAFIKSRGRGLHFDYKVRIPVKRFFKKFPNFPPYYRIVKIPLVYCKYPRDAKAYSLVRPLAGGGNTTVYDGQHSVVALGFIGYTTWVGLIAKRGYVLRCGFAGYALVDIS